MELSLKGKTAFITGGTKGIGRVMALLFAEAGADVVICGRGKENLEKVKTEIEKFGNRVYAAQVDATRSDEVKKIFSEIISKIGKLDILVNNIGSIEKFGSFLELEDEDWKR